MNPERWSRIEELFDRALELASGAERDGFLARECADDTSLHDELAAMLASTPVASSALHGAVANEAGRVATERVASQVGKKIGPYRLVSLLGEGGMGAVYLAERDDIARKVAIKIVARAIGSPQAVARFRDERQILAGLVHPNIVRLLDGGSTDDELPYLVMEYVEGTTLTKYADAKQLSVRARVELVLSVCSALQYAHGNLVVHRDVKPSNVLVDADGVLKVLDFGIAKLLAPVAAFEREAKTRTGLAPFTPEYASPEQARGEAVATTTDVYSTGAVLFELVVGRPPLATSGNPLEVLRTICEVDAPRASTVAPSTRRRELAGDLDNIIAKALHKEPGRRYASMEQLADDLRRWMDGHPVSARTATVGYRTWKFVRRNKGPVTAALIIGATLVGATVVSVRQARRADDQATRADDSAVEATEARKRAEQETERTKETKAALKQKVDALEAEKAARAAAEDDARAKGHDLGMSRDELKRALTKATEEKRIAEEESKKARAAEVLAEAAAAREKDAREKLEIQHQKELVERLAKEAQEKKITNKLP